MKNTYITRPNHTRILVHLVGNFKVTPDLMLEDVLFVPQFKFNLLSISALTKNSFISIRFFTDYCDVQDQCSLKMIGRGRRVGRLYILDSKMSVGYTTDCNNLKYGCNFDFDSVVVNNVESCTWHNRLGHLSFKRLDYLRDQLHLKNDKRNYNVPCFICPLAKQRCLSFVSNNHLSPNAFDLIHGDIWGTYSSQTRDGHRYFLTLVDDCTRFT